MCAWAGPAYDVLRSEKNPPLESGPLSETEASFVVSIPCLGAIIATSIYSLSVDKLGRRLLMFSVAVLLLVRYFQLSYPVQNY